ncbi:uncharacterized protein V1510DRAFT_371677, partial [Dipodascopsis tothii]|uniref:uncharacterized protein n=1 Tax=Dipodascopsis tothii TaxID=44089 RepID=UPI0034CF771C
MGSYYSGGGIGAPRASLKIIGNLDEMTQHWSPEERKAKRRIVCFSRSQKGANVRTSFRPISISDYVISSTCISCIFWEAKQDFYVTSVDCIFLLEQLINSRFTVEEKNRIRRNLEGYRPLTVSKGKAGSEEFFKLIMSFPNPKPRNIEKDVKVFPWKVLAQALKKIVSKYSASYHSFMETVPAADPMMGYAQNQADGSSY